MNKCLRKFAVSVNFVLRFVAAISCGLTSSVFAQTQQLDVAGALVGGQANVTSTTLDIGTVANIFDGNTNTLARTANINPMVVTLSFTTPQTLARSRIFFLGGDSEWRIETADSVAELDSMTGSFRVALDFAYGTNSTWVDRSFTNSISCRAVRLKLHRLAGDNYVHLNEWQLFLADAQPMLVDVAALLVGGQATVTNSSLDIGAIGNVFDRNTNTLARTPGINPMVVTLNFVSPLTLTRSRLFFYGDNGQWRIETADTVAELDSMTGSFRVALDWSFGAHSTWHDRSLTNPISGRAVRLRLQRTVGDNYVHLNEWELYALTTNGGFRITNARRVGGNFEVIWNSSAGQWYEVQSSTNVGNWSSAAFQKGAGNSATQQVAVPAGNHAFYRVRKALPEDRPQITKRVLVVNFDPILENHGNLRLHQYMGWNDPRLLNTNYLNDLTAASDGYVQWQVVGWVDLDLWPQQWDGFSYNDTTFFQSWNNPAQYPWHTNLDGSLSTADYGALLDLPLAALGNKSAHQLVNNGEVDEVIWWGFPYAGFYESRMVGSTAYWCNSGPLIRQSKLYVVMGLNFERGVAEAIHSFGHRSESILWRVYGSWSGNATINHLWDRFTRSGPLHGVVAGCGNVHYPPNTASEYAYNVFTSVSSEADRWLNYPNLAGSVTNVSASTWGGPDYQRNFLLWWLGHMPKTADRYVDGANAINNGKLNNWWGYLVDMNEYAESR